MMYRSYSDRKVSTYVALLIITVIGSIATLGIVHTINAIEPIMVYQSGLGAELLK